MRRAATTIAALLATTALTACESTQDKSARLASKAKTALKAEKGVTVTKPNPDVRVEQTALVQDANGVAAVVRVRNTGKTQADLPVSVVVADAKGHKLYKNDLAGLEPALVSVASLAAGEEAYWVNNQILVSGKPSKVAAAVGAPRADAPGALPRIELSSIEMDRDTDGSFVVGTATNRSAIEQRRLPIFVVGEHGGRIVAAGRAVIDKLPPIAKAKKPTRFTAYLIGDPKGARLHAFAPPTTLKEGPA